MSMYSMSNSEHDLKMDNEIVQEIRELRRKKLQWSLEEKSFRSRQAFREKDCGESVFGFSACADAVFRKSVFGVYLKSLNEKETHDSFLNENKLGITQWDLTRYSDEELKEFAEKNLLTDDMYELLLKAVRTLEVIDWDYLYESLISLRLSNCNMQWLDDKLKKFEQLVVLILTGNFLQKLPGNLLPRKLQFMEVYANEITELASLVTKSPKRILHIGLGRNKLADVSSCHLLSNSRSFRRLRTLDLSDNDFVDLQPLVEALSSLKCLQSLNLEGNPCSVCVSYKDAVLEKFQQLIYLDNAELLEKDKQIIDASLVNNAILVFNCYRITGLRAPPKQKNVKQTIHVEASFPLLEELDIAELNPEPVEVTKAPATPPPSPTQSTRSSHRGSQQGRKSKLSIRSLGRRSSVRSRRSRSSSQKDILKILKKPGPYDAPDEYEREVKFQLRNPSYQTERTTWSKIMQFPEECVVVETNESDLVKVRDTFRSCVEIRVVYLAITLPTKGKKAKSKKKEEKGDKKGKQKGEKKKKSKAENKAKEKDGKKGGKKERQKAEKEEILEEVKDDEPQKQEEPELPPLEIISKKITLVKFKCDLHSINWSDKTIDFYWAKHEEVGENAIPVEGSLKAIVYMEGKGKKTEKKEPKKAKKEKQKAATENTENIDVQEIGKQKVPNYITVQVGFGLRRSHFPKTEELQEQAK